MLVGPVWPRGQKKEKISIIIKCKNTNLLTILVIIHVIIHLSRFFTEIQYSIIIIFLYKNYADPPTSLELLNYYFTLAIYL